MSDALTPLRHAYGLAAGAAAVPGDPGHAEQEALRGMADVLAAAPPRRPSEPVLAAVRARAAEASTAHSLDAVRHVYAGATAPASPVEVTLLQQTRESVERALGARRQPRPDAAAVDAVLARAAEATAAVGLAVEDPALVPLASALGYVAAAPSAERAVLEQSLAALDRVPRPRPSDETLSSVLAFAATASQEGLGAIRYVYDDGARPAGGVEVAVLEQSRETVERAFRARPQPRPDTTVVDAVLARAAEASSLRADEPTVSDPALAPLAVSYGLPLAAASGGGVEAALLSQSQAALDRVRPTSPDAAVVANVVARAAVARPTRRATTDRPAASSSRRRPAAAWAGGAAFLLAALTAVAVLPGVFADDSAPLVSDVAVEPQAAAGPTLAAVTAPDPVEAEESEAAPAPPPSATPATPPAPTAGLAAVAERRASPAQTAAPAAVAPTPAPVEETPAWEASEDVRALSLRLDELDRSIEGLAWDEPAEAFGQPSGTSAVSPTRGLRAVREGALPSRARIQPADSSRSQR